MPSQEPPPPSLTPLTLFLNHYYTAETVYKSHRYKSFSALLVHSVADPFYMDLDPIPIFQCKGFKNRTQILFAVKAKFYLVRFLLLT